MEQEQWEKDFEGLGNPHFIAGGNGMCKCGDYDGRKFVCGKVLKDFIHQQRINEFRAGWNAAVKNFKVPNEFGQNSL